MHNGFDYDVWKERQSKIEEVYEALNQRDFHKAASLAPEGYKLCGYQEFAEPFIHERHGYGWAGQFEVTEIAPGLYPVFAKEYQYNEIKEMFTNQVKDYPGILFWYKGTLTSSSEQPFEGPYTHTVFDLPYAHSVAKDILANDSKVKLLPPFEAQMVPFKYQREKLVTYHIVDTSVPSLIKDNPMKLNRPSPAPSLDAQIQESKYKAHTHSPPTKETKSLSSSERSEI